MYVCMDYIMLCQCVHLSMENADCVYATIAPTNFSGQYIGHALNTPYIRSKLGEHQLVYLQ